MANLARGVAARRRERLPVIAGPCVVESRETALAVGRWLCGRQRETDRVHTDLQVVVRQGQPDAPSIAFAARDSRLGSRCCAEVGEATGLPLLTDVHAAGAVRPRSQGMRRAPDPGVSLSPDRPSLSQPPKTGCVP